MERSLRFFIVLCFAIYAMAATAATRKPAMYIDPNAYAYMYPYLNNQMRTALNPGTTIDMANNPIDIVVKTKQLATPRRVIARPGATTARAATTTTITTPDSNRRVVPRATTNQMSTPRTTGNIRGVARRTTYENARATANTTQTETAVYNVPTTRCLAGYIDCMDNYCARENTSYNRCYCSSKLAQIDSKYQDKIHEMTIQIIKLRDGGTWSDEEMNEYWMERIGGYVGENSWTNLEKALDIQWPTPDDRIRGQQVFLTGHEYCVAHLRNCASMASNMRDAYRSQISRDCNTYEQGLQKIKNAAAAIIENYSE